MRTVLLVLVMMVVALAAGLSFVLRAGAQEPPAATLELACRSDRLRAAVPNGLATLVTCTATTGNTGAVPLVDAQLLFMPAANLPTPDFYYFWSEVRDGVPQQVGEAQLAYDLGDIVPGAESVVVFEIIVRSTHDYGADLVLAAQPDQHEYARVTVHGTVVDGPSAIGLKLYHDQAAGTSVPYGLVVLNYTGAPYDAVRVEMSPGRGVRLEGATEWHLANASPRLVADFEPLAPDSELQRAFTVVPAAGGDCVTAQPVLVVTATQGDQVFHAAAIDDGVVLNCSGVGGGGQDGGGTSALPAAGFGPPRGRDGSHAGGPALLAGGAGALALGLALRRRAQPRS
jgi:hypothetical protein